jgi:hypothetical protein
MPPAKECAVPNSVLAALRGIRQRFRAVLSQAAVLALICASLTTFANTSLAQQGTFIFTGSLNTARYFQTATLLNNGVVLIVGGAQDITVGQRITISPLASAELYDPVTGTFTATGSLNTARYDHTATLLNNGKVLVAGGFGAAGALASAEVYDPVTGTFTATGDLNTARSLHTATQLNNGTVLIAGGQDNGAIQTTAELYDPATGTFTSTGNLNTAREYHTETLLNNGTVLVVGGYNTIDAWLVNTELYNPVTGTFTATGSLNTARYDHTATLLNNGKVLVAGGFGAAGAMASAEVYDPATGTFTATGDLNTARWAHTATQLNNGTVLIAGGQDNEAVQAAEQYDPTTGTFTSTGNLNTARYNHTATLLNNGAVLIAGGIQASDGVALASAELFELIVVSPANLSFSDQVLGTTSASLTVVLTNNQSTALSVTGIAFSGTDATDFAETDNCVGSVVAGTSCSINVTFTPAVVGSRAGNLNIAVSISGTLLTVPLTGTGVTATQIVSLSTNSLTFTNQVVGSISPAQSITLSNSGNSTVTISGLAFSGTNASEFAETDNCVGSVVAGATCTINVTFSPTATGTRTGTLSIKDNATSPPSPQTVALTGTATAPQVSVTPSSIAFPAQYVGTSGLPQSVTVMNNGSAPLSVAGVTTSATDFGMLNACGSTVAAGSSCAIGVFFDPTVSGPRTGTLTITDNAGNSPQTVTLTGSGQDFSVTPGSASSATVSPGQTANYSIAIAPAGGFAQSVALSCNGGPAGSSCAVTPKMVSLGGSAAQTATVMVTTASQGSVLPFGTGGPTSTRYGKRTPLVLCLAMALMVFAAAMRWRQESRVRWAPVIAMVVLVCAGLMLTSCGGGSAGGGGGTGTPAGTYTVTVTGSFSSGSTTLTHAANLTLVVQ